MLVSTVVTCSCANLRRSSLAFYVTATSDPEVNLVLLLFGTMMERYFQRSSYGGGACCVLADFSGLARNLRTRATRYVGQSCRSFTLTFLGLRHYDRSKHQDHEGVTFNRFCCDIDILFSSCIQITVRNCTMTVQCS